MKTPAPRRRILTFSSLALAAAIYPALPAATTADEPAPSWMALPEETVVLLRLPGGETFFNALRQQTKLGAVLFSADRVQRVRNLLREQLLNDSDEELHKALGRFDLKPDDWQNLFHGDLGAAVTLEPRKGRAPLVVVLGWLEPGEEVSQRLVAAVQTLLSELADEAADAPKRNDLNLAGHDVMHVEIRCHEKVMPEVPDFDDDDDDASEGKLQAQVEKFKQRLKDGKQVEVDRIHLFLARLGGRLLWASTVPQSSGEIKKKSDAEREAIDWDALTGLDDVTGVFSRFLAAHDSPSPGGPRRLLETPGLQATLPDGIPLLEILGDPRPLLKLTELAQNPAQVKKALEATGVAGIGPLAMRTALDGGALRSGIFLSMPAPRPGLLALVDQTPLAPEPPAWVPANAIDYQQVTFAIGKAYRRLKEMAVAESGDAGRQSFDQIETLAKTFLQVELAALLDSLGEQWSFVTFTPRFGPPAKAADDDDDDDEKPAVPEIVQRIGIVVKIDNEQPWKQLLQVIARFGQGGAAGGFKMVEEQGFSGCRMEQGQSQIGVFVGSGYLAVGIGPEVSESLLSVLTSPPAGKKSMRSSGLVERGRALLAPQPCFSYELADAGANAKVTRQAIQSVVEALLGTNMTAAPQSRLGLGVPLPFGSGVSPERKELLDKIKSLLPSDDELEGMLGVSIDQTVVTDDGLMMQSASELPAP